MLDDTTRLLLIYTRTWELWLPANGGRYSGTQGSFGGERNSGRHTIVLIAQMTRPRTRWQLCCLPALMTMKCMHEYSNQMSRQPLQTPGFQLLAPSSWVLPPGFCLWSCHCRDVKFLASATWLHKEKWGRSSLKKSTYSKVSKNIITSVLNSVSANNEKLSHKKFHKM